MTRYATYPKPIQRRVIYNCKVRVRITAYVEFKNELSSEVHRVKVIVKAPWENIEVVIPETIGDKENPANRMQITNYSFSEGGSTYYFMKVYFKCVQKNIDKEDWSEYFYCYDKDGNLLDSCYMNAPSFTVGGQYGGPVMIPKETVKVVFEEYPEPAEPDVPEEPVEPEEPEELEDPTLWTYQNVTSFDSYVDKANDNAKTAYNYVSMASEAREPMLQEAYMTMAIESFKMSKSYYQDAYDFAVTKKELVLNETSGALTDRLLQTADAFNGIEELDLTTNEAIRSLEDLYLKVLSDNTFYQRIVLELNKAFQ